MDNNINDIDKFFRDNLEGQSSPYVPGAWERMEAMLDNGNSGYLLQNANRYILASVVGAIVLAGSVVAYVSGYNSTNGSLAQKPANVAATTIETPAADTKTSSEQTNAQTQDNAENTPSTADVAAANAGDNNSTNTKTTAAPRNNKQKGIIPPVTVGGDDAEQHELPSADVTAVTADDDIEVVEPAVVETQTLLEKQSYLNELLASKPYTIKGYVVTEETADVETKKSFNTFEALQAQRRSEDSKRGIFNWNYGLAIGANFSPVLSNTGGKGWGSGLYAGLFVNRAINTRFSVGLEASYLRRNSNSISRSITQTTYFFEKTTTSYFLVTKAFDYVQVPVSINYTASTNHRFSAGFVSSILINAQTEVAQNKQNSNETLIKTTTEKGVYEDLRRFGFGLMAGYEYRLPGIYSIGLRYHQQLNDLTINSYFNDGKKHMPADVQVFLKLNLNR
ncbi:MAG: porin family protein [Bacteroidota bacterium]